LNDIKKPLATKKQQVRVLAMKQVKKYNPEIFDEDARWDEDLSPHEARRLETIVNAIPDGVRSIIDVGCGDGKLTVMLRAAGYAVMAVDQSCISGDTLPFDDESFDLAVCSEVLEHLPEPLLSNVVSELRRVSKQAIIVTVPYNEDLEYFKVTCADCGHRFNPYGHLHAFTQADLEALLPLPTDVTLIDKPQRYYHPGLKHLVFGILKRSVFVPHCVCPACKSRDFSHLKTDYIRKCIGGLNHLISRGKIRPGGWLMAIYSKAEQK
jgi:SAM-dependent methyltransferase